MNNAMSIKRSICNSTTVRACVAFIMAIISCLILRSILLKFKAFVVWNLIIWIFGMVKGFEIGWYAHHAINVYCCIACVALTFTSKDVIECIRKFRKIES